MYEITINFGILLSINQTTFNPVSGHPQTAMYMNQPAFGPQGSFKNAPLHPDLCRWIDINAHQDYSTCEDYFMLKIGQEGFLQMKQTLSTLNNVFLGVKCNEGAHTWH